MAFTPDTLAVIVQPIGGEGIRFFSYRTDDPGDEVTSSGYFRGIRSFGAADSDIVFVTPSDGDGESFVLVMDVDPAGDGTGTLSEADTSLQPRDREDINSSDFTLLTGGNFTTSSDVQILLSTANATDYWHFGSMVYEAGKNRLHWMYRKATVHTATESEVMYMFSDDGGATLWSYDANGSLVSGPSAILSSPTGRDYRDVCLGIAPNGTIIAVYTDLPIGGGATPVKMMRSKDGGLTWEKRPNVYTHPSTGARAYGRIKVIPGKGKRRMAFTMYRSDTNDVRAWYSEDMGDTWTMGSAIFSGSAENETEIAFWGNCGVAVGRKNSAGMSVSITQDYGATWTKLSDVLGSVTADVAPTVDIFRDAFGTEWVVLGACARSPDRLRWWSARLKDVLSGGGAAFDTYFDSATDMQATSGYHVPQRLPSGEWVVFEVKEDNSGGRVLRLRRMQIEKSVFEGRKWTPRLVDQAGNEATYTSQVGRYDRLGNLIRIKGRVQIATKGTLVSTNNLRVPLPVAGPASGSDFALRGGATVHHYSSTTLPAGSAGITGLIPNGASYIVFYRSATTGSVAMVASEVSDTFAVDFEAHFYAPETPN